MAAEQNDAAARCMKRHSQNIATISGLFLFVGIAFGALVIAIPAKDAADEPARIAMGAFALFWIIAGVVHRLVTKARRDRMVALLGPLRAELASANLVEIRRGHARAYAVDLVDRAGRSQRLGAPNAQTAHELVGRLRSPQ